MDFGFLSFFKSRKPVKSTSDVLNRLDCLGDQQDNKQFCRDFLSLLSLDEFRCVGKFNYLRTKNLVECSLRFIRLSPGELDLFYTSHYSKMSAAIYLPLWISLWVAGVKTKIQPDFSSGTKVVLLALRALLDISYPIQNIESTYERVRNELDIDELNFEELKCYLSFLLGLRRFDEFVQLYEAYAAGDIVEADYLKKIVHVYLHFGSYEKIRSLKDAAKNNMHDAQYVDFLLSLPSAAIDKFDLDSTRLRSTSDVLNRLDCLGDQQDNGQFCRDFLNLLSFDEFRCISKFNYLRTKNLVECSLRFIRLSPGELDLFYASNYSKMSAAIYLPLWISLWVAGVKTKLQPDFASGTKVILLTLRALRDISYSIKNIESAYDRVRNKLDIDELNFEELKCYLSFLLGLRRFDEFVQQYEAYAAAGDVVDAGYLKNIVHVYLYFGSYEKIRSLKDAAKNNMHDTQYVDFLLSLRSAAIDRLDLDSLFGGLKRGLIKSENVFRVVNLLYKKGIDFELLNGLIRDVQLSPFQRYKFNEMVLEYDQEKALALSEITPLSFSYFSDIARKLDNFYESGFDRVVGQRQWLYERVCELEKSFGRSFLLAESSFSHAWSLACFIRDRISEKRPTSFIRIGDGEAAFIPVVSAVNSFDEVQVRKRLIETWWGKGCSQDEELYEALGHMIDKAICDADIIGVVPKWRIFDGESYNEQSQIYHGQSFARMIYYFDGCSPDFFLNKTLTSCHAHQSLIRWDLYGEIFKDISSVSVISCHDLSRKLTENFGVSVRCQYFTPPESAYAERFGDAATQEAMYPDCMERILASLDVEPGEVFLVAVGFVGKYLCGVIKEKGGIALDIGSAADYFMGHQTRVFENKEIRFEPRSYMLLDTKIDAPRLHNSSRENVSDFINTDARHHRDIGVSVVLDSAGAVPGNKKYSIKLIGHPRCASGFVSSILTSCGLRVGHERFDRDGICSWMHAVNDNNVPWGDSPSADVVFGATLAFARSPITAVPSIVMENTNSRSFSFRRYHIYDLEGVDIASFDTALERAVASYTYWYKIVLRNSIYGVIRAESAVEDVFALRDDFRQVGIDLVSDSLLYVGGAVRKNDSEHKFDFKKPVFDRSDWLNIDKGLMADLVGVSERLGYSDIFKFCGAD